MEALPAAVMSQLLPQSTPALAKLYSLLGIDTLTVPTFLAAHVLPSYPQLPDRVQGMLLAYTVDHWWVDAELKPAQLPSVLFSSHLQGPASLWQERWFGCGRQHPTLVSRDLCPMGCFG